jgi:hypothetical protein
MLAAYKYNDVNTIVYSSYIELQFPSSSYYKVEKTDGRIKELKFTSSFSKKDNYNIVLNSTFTVNDIHLIVRDIEISERIEVVRLVMDSHNITAIFILPLIFEPSLLNNIKHIIVNPYLYNNSTRMDKLMLLVLDINISSILETTIYTERKKLIEGFVGYYYEIKEGIIKDVDLITQGKYSYISEESKKKILTYYLAFFQEDKELFASSVIYQVLHRSESRRKRLEEDYNVKIPLGQDLFEGFDVKKESIPFILNDNEFSNTEREVSI